MIIPSIFLPITLELLDVHFQRFFFDFIKEPDYLKYTLYKIEIGKVGFRYNVELEEHEPSTPPIPNRLINEIDALIVNDKNIEINGATREEMFPVDKNWSWGAAFIDEFYKMIYKKWDIAPHFPNVEYQPFMEDIHFVTGPAQVQLDHDFRYKYFSDDFSIEDNPENNIEQGVDKETSVLSDRPIDERKKTQWDKYNQLLLQGLPPINPTFKVSIVEIMNRPNPILYHQTEESSNSEIGAIYPNPQMMTKRGMSEWRIRRAKLFKELKDKDPNLTRIAIAWKATEIAQERLRLDLEKNPRFIGNRLEQEVLQRFKELYCHGKDKFTEEDVKNDYRTMKWDWMKAADTS